MKPGLRLQQKTSIRTKLVVVTSLLIGIISLFISFYFPAKLKKQQLKVIATKAKSISDMTAFSIGPALFFDDIESINEAFEAARQNKDLVYIVVVNDSQHVIAASNKNQADQAKFTQVGSNNSISQDGMIYKVMTPILLDGREIGRFYLGLSLKEIKAEIARSQTTSVLVSFIIFVIGMIAVFGISTVITKPLRHIVKTVEQIAQGDLTRRALIFSQDEVGHLAKSFNQMVHNLESAHKELEEMNRTLEKRVNERTKELQREIKERGKVEEALRKSEQRFRDVSENALEWIWEVTPDGKYTYSSPIVEKILGYTPDEIIGKYFYDLFHPEDREELKKAAFEEFNKKQPFREFINRNMHKNGRIIWLSTSGLPVLDENENLIGYRGVDIDITERKQAEEALRESEEKYRTIFEGSRDPVYITAQSGKFVSVNEAMLTLFGYSREEINNLNAQELYVNPEDRINFKKAIEKSGYVKNFELKLRKKDGTHLACLLTSSVRRDKDRAVLGYQGIIHDITKRKRQEEELRKVNCALKMLTECNETLVRATDETGLLQKVCQIIVRAGKYQLAWVGYAEEDEAKTVCSVAQAGNAEDYLKAVKISWADSELGCGPTGTAIRTGKPFVVKDITADSNYAPWRNQAIKCGFMSLIAIPLINNGRAFGILNIYSGEKDAFDSEEVGLLIELANDLAFGVSALRMRAEQKRAEAEIRKLNEELEQRVKERTSELKQAYKQLDTAREQFYQAQKMESVGMLAGGIAHDFNNLLATIMGNISLVKMMTKPEDKIFNILTRAENVTLRAKDLTQQLLTFSRGGAPVKKIVSIPKIIKDSVNIAMRGSKVNCEFSLPGNIWPVEVDEGQLVQVINNMIINADQAMPEGGTIIVRAENVKIDTGNELQLPEGTYVKISIQDQGVGISEENLAKIFDPFFTTKPKGTGLGLTTAYSIIKKHNGIIKVDSKIGVGTTFNIFLPASHKEIMVKRDIPEKTEASLPITGHGKILIMDDEDNVRETAEMILSHYGYEVAEAGDGLETINLYKQAKEAGRPFDVVIMDLTIKGGMGGKEAINELLKIDSDAKVIVSSGYSNDPIMADFRKYGFSGVVAKPYKVEELIKTLDRVLQESIKKSSPSTIERF